MPLFRSVYTCTMLNKTWSGSYEMREGERERERERVLTLVHIFVSDTTTLQTCSRSIPNGSVPDNCMVNATNIVLISLFNGYCKGTSIHVERQHIRVCDRTVFA